MNSIVSILKELLGLITTVRTITVTKILAAAGDYGAEDVMSEDATTGSPWIFSLNSKSGVIEKAIALCSITALTPRLTLFLFNEVPTCTLTDNAANTAVLAANKASYEGKIDFVAMEDLGTGMSEAVVTGSTFGNLPLVYNAPGKKLYGVLVTRDAIAGEVANMTMTIKLQIRED